MRVPTKGEEMKRLLGIPREVHAGEQRVSATPDTIKKLQKLGFEVCVETGAGTAAGFSDSAYEEVGASLVESASALWKVADLMLKVRPPQERADGVHEADLLKVGGAVISVYQPASNEALTKRLQKRRATVIALDQVPRITRAQKMDVLSSMANIAGYRAVIEAANCFGRLFGGQITAAGKMPPARVMVIGAGVAGLAAIAAARSLGAEVRAFDVRLAAKEQVESLGASFLELKFDSDESGETAGGYAKTMSPEFIEAEMALFLEQAKEVDIIITTALIPGRPAPVLITEEMVAVMKRGSVVVDMAAEMGGNCASTVPGEATEVNGVKILGYTDLTSRLATQASQLYGTNIVHLLSEIADGEGGIEIDLDDDIFRKCIVLHQGELRWPPPPDPPRKDPPKAAQPVPEATTAPAAESVSEQKGQSRMPYLVVMVVLAALFWLGTIPELKEFVQHLTVFVLAVFVGWQVVWNVTASLHTPLMSVTNAISGIIVVGGILQAGVGLDVTTVDAKFAAAILGAIAILFASINIAGGFLVTQRMLNMFRK